MFVLNLMSVLPVKVDIPTKSQDELRIGREQRENNRQRVCDEASFGDKVRYKSPNNPDRFLHYLQSRVPILESKPDRYATRMLEKTRELISKFSM